MLNNTGFSPQLKFKGIDENVKSEQLNVGYLVFLKTQKKIMFLDAFKKHHPLDRVSFLASEWNLDNGVKNLPKPYVLDEGENIEEYGDNLLYSYLGGTIDRIVVLGSLIDYNFPNSHEQLKIDVDNLEHKAKTNNNKKRYLNIEEDGKGNVTIFLKGKKEGVANLKTKISGNEQTGNYSLEADGKIAITIVKQDGDTEKATMQLLLDAKEEMLKVKDVSKNEITINKDGIDVKAEQDIKITTQKNVEITSQDTINVKADKVNVEAQTNAVVKGQMVQITGGQLKVGGASAPTGTGSFCALLNCLFTGAPHTSDTIQGT
jgi:hypothetical protein